MKSSDEFEKKELVDHGNKDDDCDDDSFFAEKDSGSDKERE